MIIFRKATLDDVEQLGYVHYVSWIETYKGLISDSFLSERSPEKSAKMFQKSNFDLIYVAEDDMVVTGFVNFNLSRDDDLDLYGAVYALYVLKTHQHRGIGRRLMNYAITYFKERDFKGIAIWVLSTNQNAITFYKHIGFIQDGRTKEEILGEKVTEIRMIKKFK